jgi:hypothetical protein
VTLSAIALSPRERHKTLSGSTHPLARVVRVRQGEVYLWGSASIAMDPAPNYGASFLLHVHNDPYGDPVALGTLAAGAQTALGKLQPGETFSIPLQALTGVYATCDTASSVLCVLNTR